jgi:hypothetical protein
MTHLIVTGNPLDGFTYHGPYSSSEAAVAGAADRFDGADWWVVPVTPAHSADDGIVQVELRTTVLVTVDTAAGTVTKVRVDDGHTESTGRYYGNDGNAIHQDERTAAASDVLDTGVDWPAWEIGL